LKGKTDQKWGLEPITVADVKKGIERANEILNERYKTMRSEVLAPSEGQIEEKPGTGKADARTSGATTTTSSSVKTKGASKVETGGGKVSTREPEKKQRIKLSSFKSSTSTVLPKQTDPEHKLKMGRHKSEQTLLTAGLTHRPEPPEKKERLPIVGKFPAPFDRESDEDQLSHDDDPRQGKNEHTPDGKVKPPQTNYHLSEAENEESRTGYRSDHANSEASEGDDERSGPTERLSETRDRVRKKLDDSREQTTPGSDQKRKRDPDDSPSGSEGHLY
jgi:hypothetical protein